MSGFEGKQCGWSRWCEEDCKRHCELDLAFTEQHSPLAYEAPA